MATADPLSSLEGDMLDVAPGVKAINGDFKATSHIERLPNVASETLDAKPEANGTHTETQKCDVLVVGAGFSGITAIHRFRKLGMSVKCFEGAGDFGGTWYWNRYPGARVDSEAPFYQLNIPEVYNTFNFSQRFSGHEELRRYFSHVEKVLDLRKDVTFNAQVVDCSWTESAGRWTVKTASGHSAECKYLFLGTGALYRKYTPDFPGLESYKGKLVHSGAWPEDLDCTGKKVGLIGAGATAVQITQELGKVASQLSVFLRRPSYCLPIGQRSLSTEESHSLKAFYPTLFETGRHSRAGFPATDCGKPTLEATPEERQKLWEDLWTRGGFQFMMLGYNDYLVNPEANRLLYDFWASKVKQRLTDPKKQAIMTPEVPPYYIGTKRFPLEHDYYDVLNQDNVELVDLKHTALESFEEKGMRMDDGTLREFDIVVLATGFDSFTGSLTNMGLKNKDGVDLRDIWKDGVSTYLGLTIAGFPNVFM
jgi:cation diffusion facilitator CzcD-associated flavoprotein CzcO